MTRDFKSLVSTNFTISAKTCPISGNYWAIKKGIKLTP